jgi:ribosome-associated toxin RatA of RatAB toxin-antitoxin module
MPYVERSMVVRGAVDEVYELAKDFPAYAGHMPDVRSVTVKERGEGYTVTAWDVAVMGRAFRWTERDEFDDAARVIRYRQLSGDLAEFKGEWRFEDTDDGVRVVLSVEFELGIPMLAALLNPVLIKAVESNADQLLQALGRRVAGQAERSGEGSASPAEPV